MVDHILKYTLIFPFVHYKFFRNPKKHIFIWLTLYLIYFIWRNIKHIWSDKNNLYIITFNIQTNSNLTITSIQKNDSFQKSFSNKFTIEKIKENKYFSMCDNLEEIYSELESRIKINEIKLVEQENNLMVIIILPSIKIKEVTFLLNEDKKNENQKMDELIKIISELKNEINSLKNENNQLKEKIDEIQKNNTNEINILKNNILEQKKEIDELKNKLIIDLTKDLTNSVILENDEITFVKQLFSNNCKFNLIYRATRDGSYPKDFHRQCDDKGPTITLIKTKDNKKFGGYISKDRKFGNENEKYVQDKNAFIFSINKKKKYPIKNENTNAFSYSSIRGPNFTVKLGFYKNRDDGNFFNPLNAYESETIPDYNSFNNYEFAGRNNFETVEVEVFQVKIN